MGNTSSAQETIARHAETANAALAAAGGVAGNVATTAAQLKAAHESVTGAFEKAKRMHGGSRAKVGGGDDCDCGIYGAAEEVEARMGDLHEYEKSLSEGAKDDVIRRIARAMKRAGISVDPEAPLGEITAQLVKEIPNPRHGKSFVGDAKAQEKVCRIIADVLNDEFTPGATKDSDKFIDTSFSAAEVCRKVSEWSHSFASGVNTEFLAVHASVRNALRNLVVVDEVMERAFGQVTDAIDAAGDDALSRRATRPADLVIRAQGEQRHLLRVLQNMMQVHLAPAAKELELAMRDSSEAHAVVKRLGLRPGERGFGDGLAESVSSLGASAAVAHRVNRALKAVGLSAKDYVGSDRFADFEAKLDAIIESGSIKGADLAKVLRARDELRASFESRGALKLGGRQRRGGADDDDESLPAKTGVEKRLRAAKTEAAIVTHDFVARLARHYDELLGAIGAMGPKLGKEIPLTDKSNALREAFGRLNDMQDASSRIELALIGRYVDADARSRKEMFVNNLRMISTLCDDVMALEAYRAVSAHFARLRAAIDGIIKTIDYFSDVITKQSGGLTVEDAKAELPVIASSGLSLKKAIAEFSYFYYVANVRVNLTRTSKELDGYGKGYTDLLGDAVASRIYQLNTEREAVLARCVPGGTFGGVVMGAGALAWLPPAARATLEQTKSLEVVIKFIKDEYEVKQQFYESLQAMDLYMKAFTSAIVSDPDAMRDIKQIMDGTQTIARWFNEETGESVWRAFEGMQSIDAAGNAVAANVPGNITNQAANPGGADHYYTRVGPAATDTNIGVPTCGVNPVFAAGAADDAATAVKKSVGKAIDNFQSLHNLVNAFARIGDKFGGKELRKQVFRSPTQIYNSLIKYLKQSALSIYHTGAAAALTSNPLAAVVDTTTPLQVYFGSVGAGTCVGNYEVENKYFAMIIKAMAAKILTAVGVYDMFERVNPKYDLTPTRMIVGGGGDEADPDVLEGAAELYFRLPRLVEFYYELLYKTGSDGEGYKIAILPELQGVFAGIIRLAFVKFSSTSTGEYSDSELRMLINEINAIYEHFRAKDAGQATRLALLAFVEEINRRYGVIKNSDLKAFWTAISDSRTGQASIFNKNDTNYAILPDEGETETVKPAPSDRFFVDPRLALPGRAANGRLLDPFKNSAGFDTLANAADRRGRLMVTEFRARLDAYMSDRNMYDNFRSYALHIQQASLEIRRASSRSDKLKAAMGLILSSTVVTTNTDKALMFNETVVTGLNTLSAIEAMVTAYDDSLDLMNPKTIESIIMDTLYLNSVAQFRRADGTNGGVLAPVDITSIAELLAEIPNRLLKYAAAGPIGVITRYIKTYNMFGLNSGIPNDIVIDDVIGVGGIGAAGVAVHPATSLSGNASHAFTGALIAAGGAASAANVAVGVDVATLVGAKLPSNYKNYAEIDNMVLSDLTGNGTVNGLIRVKGYLKALRIIARMITNHSLIMEDYVDAVFDFSSKSQGLVEVNWVGKSLQLGFSKLQGTVDSLLEDVKYYFEQFRPYMSKAVVDRFELKANAGSIYWIEENLIDKRIRGVNGNASDPGTFNSIGARTKAILTELTKKYSFGYTGMINAGGIVPLNIIGQLPLAAANPQSVLPCVAVFSALDDNTNYESYGQTFSRMLFYHTTGLDALGGVVYTSDINNVELIGAAVNEFPLVNLVLDKRPDGRAAGVTGKINPDANVGYYPFSGMNNDRSLLFAYNQLIAQYLSTMTDQSGARVYINLVNSFANGTASQSVSQPIGNAFPDIKVVDGVALAVNVQTFGIRGDPKATATLFQSLAYILQRLTKDVNPTTQISDHLISTLTDVPMYMKESYRANLPSFVKLFDALALRGDFIKQLFQKTDIKLDRPIQVDLYAAANLGGVNPRNLKCLNRLPANTNSINANTDFNTLASLNAIEAFTDAQQADSQFMKSRFVAIIDAIAAGAYTLSNAASEVLRELADSPVYFQTQEGSIETYRMRYSAAPLMPLSLSLWTLQDVPVAAVGFVTPTALFPNKTLGAPEFKLLYGARGLIAGSAPVGYDQMPGALALLKSYNGLSEKREQIDETRYLRFAQNVVTTLRYLADARHYKSMLIGRAAGAVGVNFGFAQASAVYALQTADQTAAVISVVESSNQPDEINNIIRQLLDGAGAAAADPRKSERIQNLIDMNIIPINVHALMRDIPLANLYNYEYTFEQMVCSLFGEVGIKETDAGTKNTKQMFLRLLKDPYMEVTAAMYGDDATDLGSQGYVHRIFRGDNDLGLGRPKFLSDQLFNKALFGSVYQSASDYDEGGPGVGIGAARGRASPVGQLQEAMAELSSIANEISLFRQKYNGNVQLAGRGGAADGDPAHLAALAVLNDMPIPNWVARLNRVIDLVPLARRAAIIAIRDLLTAAPGGMIPLLAIANTAPPTMVRADAVWALLSSIGGTIRATIATQLGNGGNNLALDAAAAAAAATRQPGAIPDSANWRAQNAWRSGSLTYLTTPDGNADEGVRARSIIQRVNLAAASKQRLQQIGKARFDTTFVRNLFFITNVSRVVRLKLSRELTQTRNVIVSSHEALAAGVTEYGTDGYGTNDVFSSTMNGQSRFNDS